MSCSTLRRVATVLVVVVIAAGAMTQIIINSANAYGRAPTDQGWLKQWDTRLEPVRQALTPDRAYGFRMPNPYADYYAYTRGVDAYLLAPIIVNDQCDGPLALLDAIDEETLHSYLAEHPEIVIEQFFGNGLALQRVERQP